MARGKHSVFPTATASRPQAAEGHFSCTAIHTMNRSPQVRQVELVGCGVAAVTTSSWHSPLAFWFCVHYGHIATRALASTHAARCGDLHCSNTSSMKHSSRCRQRRVISCTCVTCVTFLVAALQSQAWVAPVTHSKCGRPSPGQEGSRRRARTPIMQTQDAGQGDIRVPDTLRDVIVERIEELGGGRVKEVIMRQ